MAFYDFKSEKQVYELQCKDHVSVTCNVESIILKAGRTYLLRRTVYASIETYDFFTVEKIFDTGKDDVFILRMPDGDVHCISSKDQFWKDIDIVGDISEKYTGMVLS